MNDHDLLVRIDERVEKLDDCLRNHLSKHWAISLAVIGATLMGLAALLINILGR